MIWAILGALGTLFAIALGAAVFFLFANDLRLRLKRALRRRLTKEQLRVIEQFRVELNPHKLEKKGSVRLRLLSDPELRRELEAHAKKSGEPLDALLDRVDDYADEIIPFFSVVSYYRVGYTVAALAVRALYWPWKDKREIERVRAFLDEAQQRNDAVVFLMNHRSNADFVLVAYVLARAIALSYAVGEWARVWPLEQLFKSFGSYFVRRGCKDPVYHLVLRRYMQIITDEGVTQGIFIEGGLSRDGALRPAKIGLLDSLATRPDPSAPVPAGAKAPAREVWFLPVGINYDRVLEDEVLTREVDGAEGMGSGLAWYLSAATRVSKYLFANLPRYFVRRVRKFGYAAVHFGEPVALSALFDRPIDALRTMDRDARKPVLQTAADLLLAKIAAVVPVTPVPLVTAAILGAGADGEVHVTEAELRDRLTQMIDELRAIGVPVVGHERGVAHLEKVGLTILKTRGHIERVGGVIVTKPATRHLLRYYLKSLEPQLARIRALPEHAATDELQIHARMPEKEAV
ncbi:1-acyl-sn-glycerol-3-phosphate acyltransferase [Myxococcota bacterium]|nr:1-acyl-sn-glycerol-3-phosphate acyltransferase [Myxococcota bacterium]